MVVDPGEGVAIRSWQPAGRDLLVPAGLLEPFSGLPLLFPNAGALADGKLATTGTAIPKHGFAWKSAWRVVAAQADFAELALVPPADAAAQFPFRYRAVQEVRVTARGLHLALTIFNDDTVAMPLAPGWHPYFPCPRESRRAVRIEPAFTDFSFLQGDGFDVGCDAPSGGEMTVAIPGLAKLRLSFSAGLGHVQFWSAPGGDFICVEPFVGPPNAMNTARRLEVAPGARADLTFEIQVVE